MESFLVDFIKSIAVPALVTSGIIHFYIKHRIKTELNKEVETHIAELTQIRDREAFNYQRKIHDFTLYSTKRHDIYIQIYKSLLDAKSKVFSLIGGISNTNFNFYSVVGGQSEMHEFIETEEMTHVDREELKLLAKTNEVVKFDKKVKEIDKKNRINEASKAIVELNNEYLLNELFISVEVSNEINSFLSNLRKLYSVSIYNTSGDWTQLKDGLTKQQQIIKEMIKEELSIGDYKDEK